MNVRILLTGKTGQLGFELRRALAPLGEIVAPSHAECDLADADAVRDLVRSVKPHVIVNPAAYTAVDKAESDADTAYAINATAPGILGEEAARISATVLHYSTDYVFDGHKSGAYLETDPTAPQGVYGASKLAGEAALSRAHARSLILRTSWVVGAHGGNFAKTMLRLATERDSLSVVSDQFGAPTSAALLADISAHLVRQVLRDRSESFEYGLYHVAASGRTSWYDYARFVLGEAARAGKRLKVQADDIRPIATADYPTPARRPLNSSLDTRRFRDTFDLKLPDWHDGVSQVLQQIL